MEEIAHPRVVAIAINGLAPEVVLVVFQFILDVRELCIESIVLLLFGLVKGITLRHQPIIPLRSWIK